MSDTSQGPGWWVASDGKWYSPEQAAQQQPPPPAPVAIPPSKRPWWRTWPAIAVAVLIVLFVIGVAVAQDEGNVLSLEVGQCFNDPDDLDQNVLTAEISNVEIVDCTDPHDNEVYSLYDMTDASFPGLAIALSRSHQECALLFEAYVGREYTNSSLVATAYVPTSETWDLGERGVTCFLYDPTLAKLTTSAKGSGL